ncbi:hypothetical protein L195_g002371, partial [Trifolium pratense]
GTIARPSRTAHLEVADPGVSTPSGG